MRACKISGSAKSTVSKILVYKQGSCSNDRNAMKGKKKTKNGQRTEKNCAENKRAGKNTRYQDNGLELETK